jgi:hypothetical protein
VKVLIVVGMMVTWVTLEEVTKNSFDVLQTTKINFFEQPLHQTLFGAASP